MDQNNGYIPEKSPNTSEGYLVIKVSTARGAIPLEGASVIIRSADTPDSSSVKYSLRSNSDGITEKVALPTPPASLSGSPGQTQAPYSLWSIDVLKNGYIPLYFQKVPVYSSVVSIQPAVMIPLSESFTQAEIFNESEVPRL